jgi:hypothetical protein
MKKTFLLCLILLFANIGYSQFSPTGTNLTDNKFRAGGLGIGYSTTPTFGSNKFLVNGSSLFNGNILLNNGSLTLGTVSIPSYWNINSWSLRNNGSILVSKNDNPAVTVYSSNPNAFGFLDLAIATNDYAYSNNSVAGDIVFRGYTGGSMIFDCQGAGDIKFTTVEDTQETTPSKVQMTITKEGDVGIGTGTPDSKLAVNGVIHSKEVVVDLIGWPDYVFESDYDLMTLEELEKSIEENKHLPNIPNAKEVEENGVQLGEMNKKLLQKVEELTLYIIQLSKEIEVLKEQSQK